MAVFCLDETDFEQAKEYNRLISEAGMEQLTFVRGDYQYQNEATWEEYDLAGLFGVCNRRVVGISFDKEELVRTGNFNTRLKTGCFLELAGRLAAKNGTCRIMTDTLPNLSEEYLETWAYMLRFHLTGLKEAGLLERVFGELLAQAGEQATPFQTLLNRFLQDNAEYDRIRKATALFVVIRGDDTCAGVMQVFADEMAAGLIQEGQAVRIWDKDDVQTEDLENLVKGMVGFQSPILSSKAIAGIRGKRYQVWLDYPAPFGQYFVGQNPEEYRVLCQDGNHAAFINRYFGEGLACHMPLAGVDRGYFSEKDRPYDIVFVGSYFPEQDVFEEESKKQFYDYMLEHPQETFEEGLTNLLSAEGTTLTEEAFLARLVELRPVYRSILAHFRRLVMERVLEAGFSVHVYGDSWNSYPGENRQLLVIHPEIPSEESFAEWGKAKIGLNIMSWHKDGMTERVANIMLSGAVCVTEKSKYLAEELAEETVQFSLEHLETIPGIIRELMTDDAKRIGLAQKAYHRAKQDYTWRKRAQEIIEDSEAENEMDTEKTVAIFMATHVKFNPPANPIYIPLHVGREGKEDLGYLGDNVGENISDLNYLFGELTGLFWIWQNIHDIDYVGLCHYRRHFLNDNLQLMSRDEYVDFLSKYDVIVAKHAECEGSYYEHYGRAHDAKYLDVIGQTIDRLTPEYSESYQKAMHGTTFFSGNLMVASLEVVKGYAEWLFTIFMESADQIDVTGYDAYHMRIFGFLSEQMLYVYMMANHLTYRETNVGISEEKAETAALKSQVKALMQENRYVDAALLFNEVLEVRPDILLPASDLYGELNALYKELKERLEN